MIIDATKGARGVLLANGERVPFPRWANLDTGEFTAFAVDPATGKIANPARLYRARADRLRFIPSLAPSIKLCSAPPQVPVTSQTCVRGVPIAIRQDRPCQHYACTRLAEWKVADEEELPPATMPDGRQFERARTVGVRFYCPFHYEAPRLLDARGELIREHEVTVRPQ